MEKVLSIIVPAYNSEPYLEKCLNSFITAPPAEELEVVVVNDGSTDNTGSIAKRFVEKYPQLFQILNKENGGHGSAINAAAPICRGIYFKVIDADDWVVTENLPKLISMLKKHAADAVITSFDMIDMRTGQKRKHRLNCECNRIYTLPQMLDIYPKNHMCFTFHGILYNRNTYLRTGFRLSEKIYYEDHEFSTIPFLNVRKVLLLDLVIYQYQIGNASQSVAFPNQVARIGQIRTVIERIWAFQKQYGSQNPDALCYFYWKLASVISSYYAVALIKNPDKKQGRLQASKMHEYISAESFRLQKMTDRKYWTMRLMNYLGLNPDIYERLLGTPLYRLIRRVWNNPGEQ